MVADENFYPSLFKYDFKIHLRHYQRYFESLELLNRYGKRETWLDCACGSGYGTRLLGDFCENIIGFDIDETAIGHAKEKYENEKCIFTSDPEIIKNEQFSVIFSIETIEHMIPSDGLIMLTNMRKWLRGNGYLAITTPIVPVSNPYPINPFHNYEYDLEEFSELLFKSGFNISNYSSKKVVFTDGEEKQQTIFLCQ